MEVMKWWYLTENNDHEGEIWNFYIPYFENSNAIRLIEDTEVTAEDDGFTSGTLMAIEKTFRDLPSHTSYMQEHTVYPYAELDYEKVKKDLTDETFWDNIYKGSISNYFVKE